MITQWKAPTDVFERLHIPRTKADQTEDTPRFVPSTNRKGKKARSGRIEGLRTVRHYDIDGNHYDHLPNMSAAELRWYYNFVDALMERYVDNKPIHLSRPELSQFKGFSKSAFNEEDPSELRRQHTSKSFIVRDSNFKSGGFTLNHLAQFAPVDQDHIIHDYSLGEIGSSRFARASLRDIHNEHLEGDSGVIMNLLDLPGNAAIHPHPLFTDVTAFRTTRKCPLPTSQGYPVRDTRFVLVATKDATHGLHNDSDGFCTFVTTLEGLKLWATARPLDPTTPPLSFFGDLTQFIREWSQVDPNREKYILEAVVLRPGDTLYMRSLVSHAVFTLESSICIGGHYYCSSTMSDSVASLVTSLLLEPRITNTQHVNSRYLLQLMAIHCYDYMVTRSSGSLPSFSEFEFDIQHFQGWHSFVMLQVAVVLGPVLDPRFYRAWTKKPASEEEILTFACARGAALATMEHLGSQTNWITVRTSAHPHGVGPNVYFNEILLQTATPLLAFFLLPKFDKAIIDNPPKQKPRSLPAIPLPDEKGKITFFNRMVPGRQRRTEFDSYSLIQRGMTKELKKPIQGFHSNNIAKKEEDA
ncbi:hypothetical protein NMY22_g19698 [Coprinellus aureogranulatus]|nr:hypothetical protein NMY22_g19698 [Coprinellus aureogranulatus]